MHGYQKIGKNLKLIKYTTQKTFIRLFLVIASLCMIISNIENGGFALSASMLFFTANLWAFFLNLL